MRFGFRYIYVILYFYFSSKHFMEEIVHHIKRSYCSKPLLDNPITGGDVPNARKGTKKGGYGFTLSALDIILKVLIPTILMLLNIYLFIQVIERLV